MVADDAHPPTPAEPPPRVLAAHGGDPASAAGNPDGHAPVPPEARAVDTSHPDRVVGNGTPASCTSKKVVQAVARGGIIRFKCGPRPVTIKMTATAKVFNDRPGRGHRRQGAGHARWRRRAADPVPEHLRPEPGLDHVPLPEPGPPDADGAEHHVQARPLDAAGRPRTAAAPSSCAAAGSRWSTPRFFGNRCASTGPDVGGAAIQVFSQFEGLPVYVVKQHLRRPGRASATRAPTAAPSPASACRGPSSTACSTNNRAIGSGANPPKAGTPGGGNGGAIYNDGNEMTLRVAGTRIVHNRSNHEGGSAIFFVSNDRTGDVEIEDSVIRDNTGDGFSTYPGIFFLGRHHHVHELHGEVGRAARPCVPPPAARRLRCDVGHDPAGDQQT